MTDKPCVVEAPPGTDPSTVEDCADELLAPGERVAPPRRSRLLARYAPTEWPERPLDTPLYARDGSGGRS